MVLRKGVLITRRRRLPSTELLPPAGDFLRALIPELSKEFIERGHKGKGGQVEGGQNQEWAWWIQWSMG